MEKNETIDELCREKDFIMQRDLNGLKVCALKEKDAYRCNYCVKTKFTDVGLGKMYMCKAIQMENQYPYKDSQ